MNQSSNSGALSKGERKKEAIRYLRLGQSKKDVKSIAMLYDLLREKYNPTQEIIDERKDILKQLLDYERDYISAEIRVKGSCFNDVSILGSLFGGKTCDSICSFANYYKI